MIFLISGSNSGYYIGLGIEAAVALVAGVLLVLLLANVFVKKEKQDEPASEPTETLPDAVEGEIVSQEATPEKETKDEKQSENKQSLVINVFNNGTQAQTEAKPAEEPKEEKAEPEAEPAEESKEKDPSIKFTESKSIEEMYDELTEEQKAYFDALKKKALSKPQAVLSVTRNYQSVKVGKHSILKLLVRKGVTVAEFLLESDLLKEYKKNSDNKKGKSKIKIRPTVIAVTDLDSLKTALDMIDLAHEQLFDD